MNNHNPFDETQTDDDFRDDGDQELLTNPTRIGRYTIERELGRGGFGSVFLAFDTQLDRYVAVKVPRPDLVPNPEDAAAYLTEARTVANLDHAHIVPVYDVGATQEFPCFIVSKYIEGTDLSAKLKSERFSYIESAELVATVADALHYAHKQGLVHRDIKPGNILISNEGRPYVADFGLALREEDVGKGPTQAGTAAYMSPEQARGEGHRVDGRSDIFSLGVVLYQLLVDRRPFRGDSQTDVLDKIIGYEPRPLRQYDEKLPKELDRICSRAMSKRACDRYASAYDMAEDLRHFITEQKAAITRSAASGSISAGPGFTSAGSQITAPIQSEITNASGSAPYLITTDSSAADSAPIRIVPKGLRSFDAHDADFFLELLPGPRDRDGLPDGLRFWKSRVEESDPDKTFSVGLIYGQSGCGKSSLIKAGLLPRLSDDVATVYIEATPEETEVRLLRGLRKRCPALPVHLSLKESLTSLRRGLGVPIGRKLLIIIDQFEQWLHGCHEENSELVQALRQCDGGRVQCLVMVRDDFWMAATRFMRELEFRLLEGENSAAVDLFPIRHAEQVLAAFGRAYGILSDTPAAPADGQQEFIRQAAAGLAEDGKVVCVRLALFAEMMKGRPWCVETLKQVGGTKGLGAAFLEENFSASSAPPEHRFHEQAARKVLGALLPEAGANIRGAMKSYDELLEVSGYRRRRRDFDDLLKTLDTEIRLLTPTDPDGVQEDDGAPSRDTSDQRYYQLTHDYLVPSLRAWLTRRQKETKRGRAELQLQERAAVWSNKQETRYLPSLIEFCNIRVRTERSGWNEKQSAMMSQAGRHHGIRIFSLLAVLLLTATGISSYVRRERERNSELMVKAAVDALQNSHGPVVPYAIDDLREFPETVVVSELQRRIPESTGRRRLTLGYALSALTAAKAELLVPEIRSAPPAECANITTALATDPSASVVVLSEALQAADDAGDLRLKARLAIILLALNHSDGAADMLRIDRADPVQRTIFIDEFMRWHGGMEGLARSLTGSAEEAVISGVCLAVGRISRDDFSESEREQWERLLLRWYLEHPAALIHSSAGFALRQWGTALPAIPARPAAGHKPFTWHTSLMGLTMISLPAGSMEFSDKKGNPRVIACDADFLICDREVSVHLFHEFLNDPSYENEKPTDWEGEQETLSPTEMHPVQQVSWNDAVMFCNWLSFREGLERCYTRTEGDSGAWELIPYTNGYRLLDNAEWEYACRAGTRTRFICGDDAEFLEDYAVYRKESFTEPCGSRFCNAWGIFDMPGNVWEWVNDFAAELPGAPKAKHCLRGGSRGVAAVRVESDVISHQHSARRSSALGFRVARNARNH